MSTKLFGEEENQEEAEENLVEISPLVSKRDKIFNNDYNTGNLEFEEYGPPKVESEYAEAHMESYHNSNEYYFNLRVMERIDDHFRGSDTGKIIGLKKKIPKQLLSKIYLNVREAFTPGELSEKEYFINLAEYFGMSYEVLYENIPAIYRELIVRELDNKFGVLKRKGIRKLF